MTDAAGTLSTLPPDRMESALRLVDYMLGEARMIEDADDVLAAMSEQIVAAGVPLDRASSIVQLLHAEAVASARFWDRGQGTRSYLFPFDTTTGEEFVASPAAHVLETGEWLTLWLPDTPDESYNIVAELKEAGHKHYTIAPVFMRNGMNGTFSFASNTRFSDSDLAFLRAVFPALAACQEILATHRVMGEVMRMYVGEEPKKRILSGDVHRGEVMHIRSAILFADMRRFTELTADMEAEAATELLNAYYDCVVPAVEAQGGEVLKFIGDGILAIFRAEGDGSGACSRAVKAANDGLAKVAGQQGAPHFEVGIALHFGEVAFGNVGSGLRQDYTVIGRDVNLAARVAGLCGELNRPLLGSAAFCERLGMQGCENIGEFALKGLGGGQPVFRLT